jgi:hypothetical protein
MRAALLALAFASSAALADPLHYSLSGGVGHSYSMAGPRLEVAGEQWGGFVSPSVANIVNPGQDFGLAAGIRWTSGDRQGLVLSLHGDLLRFRSGASPQTLAVFALTAGYRFRYQRFWFEVAAGPALYIDSHYVDSEFPRGVFLQRQIGFGALGGQDNPHWPDAELAIGFEL